MLLWCSEVHGKSELKCKSIIATTHYLNSFPNILIKLLTKFARVIVKRTNVSKRHDLEQHANLWRNIQYRIYRMHFSHHADGVEVSALDSPFRLPVPDACAYSITLQWRHDQWDDVSNHRRLDCLLNRWFRRRSKKTSKLRDTGLCEGNPPVTGGFPSQRASNAVNVSIWWGHHGICSSGCFFLAFGTHEH